MSKFATAKINAIAPYVPGEQPRDKRYVKLNTNENPYYTSQKAVKAISENTVKSLNRYSDPECKPLVAAVADYYGVGTENVLITNGSDEALAFCFQAYGSCGVCYPDVTYGFYDVFANMYDCPAEHITLNEDFSVDETKYFAAKKTVVLANPNAQTGKALTLNQIEKILIENCDNIVIIDQAYVDFGENCNVIPLIKKYKNLVAVNTFSKSRSLAGGRIGFIVADKELICDLNKVKYSFHPYNVNTLSMLLAKNAIEDDEYFKLTVSKIKKTRQEVSCRLKDMGFEVVTSSANFVLAKTDKVDGGKLYELLKDRGVLVRHFSDERIKDYIRITIGTDEEMKALTDALVVIMEEYR